MIIFDAAIDLDIEVRDTRGPVVDFPAQSPSMSHFVQVKITDELSLRVTTAADAQELEMRFAAARHYLTGEPSEFARQEAIAAAGPEQISYQSIGELVADKECKACGSTGEELALIRNPVTGAMETFCLEVGPCYDRCEAAKALEEHHAG